MLIRENISLLPFNTFRMDVKAKIFAEYSSVEELRALLEQYKGEPLLHIGAGSNLLFTKDFDGVVLHSAMRRARCVSEDADYVWIEAENGLVLDELIAQLCDMGISGLENLSYIPGEVGASAVQNVGAYGVEAKDVIESVRAVSIADGAERIFSNAECQYGYRDSIFKNSLRGKYIITHVVYRLNKHFEPKLNYGNLSSEVGFNPTPMSVREAVIRIRQQKLPEVSELGSAGSFFKNPVVPKEKADELLKLYPDMPHYNAPSLEGREGVGLCKIPAAWLIEQCGWKGKMMGGAQCYEKQPLVLVNRNNATPEDIVNLAAAICKDVKEKFGIAISPEVNYI
ncbi:MAG: UDP-N-acetylmuramate dehydrogenase [Paludibacteraceae bacterium]|nr:UDP-N-acetylmuramate dehydrogenase [Paludibacteraceae bacterium]